MERMLAELLRWTPQAAAPAGARWSAWARALAARHARADARTRPVAMMLVTRRGAAARWSWTTLALRPRLELARSRAAPGREVAPARARAGGARSAPAGAMAPTHAPARLASPPASPWSAAPFVLAASPPSARTHERAAGLTLERSRLIVQRLVQARGRREEPRGLPAPGRRALPVALPASAPVTAPAPATAASSRAATPGRPPGARSPAMVLAAPAAAPGARDRAPDGAPAAREHPQAARPAAAPAVETPIDIGVLTDQVVRQLDRRIVAHRERMGRI